MLLGYSVTCEGYNCSDSSNYAKVEGLRSVCFFNNFSFGFGSFGFNNFCFGFSFSFSFGFSGSFGFGFGFNYGSFGFNRGSTGGFTVEFNFSNVAVAQSVEVTEVTEGTVVVKVVSVDFDVIECFSLVNGYENGGVISEIGVVGSVDLSAVETSKLVCSGVDNNLGQSHFFACIDACPAVTGSEGVEEGVNVAVECSSSAGSRVAAPAFSQTDDIAVDQVGTVSGLNTGGRICGSGRSVFLVLVLTGNDFCDGTYLWVAEVHS